MPRFESTDDLIASYPEYFNPEKAKGTDGVVQLNLTGEGSRQFYLKIHDQTLDVEEGTHDDPDTTVTTSAEDWLAVNNGEANPMQLMMQGRLKVDGSLPLATKFQSMFG